MTEAQKALRLVNMLRLNAPAAEAVPAAIRAEYTALLQAYQGLSDVERERVFLRARYDAGPAEQRGIELADPDLLIEVRHGTALAGRLAAVKSIREAREAALAARGAAGTGGSV